MMSNANEFNIIKLLDSIYNYVELANTGLLSND